MPGISAITNPGPVTNGRDAETDADRTIRFRGYVAALARGTGGAIVYGAKGDRLAAENAAKAAARRREEGSVTPGPSGDVAGAPRADG